MAQWSVACLAAERTSVVEAGVHGGHGADDGTVFSVFEIVARDAKRVVAAVALAFSPDERQAPAGELIAAVGEELLSRGEELLSRADFTRIPLTQ